MISDYLILIAAPFGVLFVHEFGHLLAARCFGVKVLSITVGFGIGIVEVNDRFGTCWKLALLPVSGSCRFLNEPAAQSLGPALDSPQPRALSDVPPICRAAIYAAGPVGNIALAAVFFCVALFQSGRVADVLTTYPYADMAVLASGLSLAVALFNLLPIPPLDGARIARFAIEAWREHGA
jgi:membrane-associated protease RseP (regulator of RpoE activity)